MSEKVISEKDEGIFQSFAKVWKECFNYKSRIGRYDFWSFCFVSTLIYIFLKLVAVIDAPFLLKFVSFFGWISIVPLVAAIVRRLHDINRHVWIWFVIPIIVCFLSALFLPLIRVFVIFLYGLILTILCCKKGKIEDNQYGAALVEDKKQTKSVYWLIFLMIILPLLLCGLVLGVGAVSGYHRAMNKYQNTKIIKQIEFISNNLHTLNGAMKNYENVNNLYAINSGVVPLSMTEKGNDRITTANGYNLKLFGEKDRFMIQLFYVNNANDCLMLFNTSKTELSNLYDFKINESATDCMQCDKIPCTLTWTYQ